MNGESVIEGKQADQLLQLIRTISQNEIDRRHSEQDRLTDLLGMLMQLIEAQASRNNS